MRFAFQLSDLSRAVSLCRESSSWHRNMSKCKVSEKYSALNGINASLSTPRLGDAHGRGMWKDSLGLEVREDWSEQCLLGVTGPPHS